MIVCRYICSFEQPTLATYSVASACASSGPHNAPAPASTASNGRHEKRNDDGRRLRGGGLICGSPVEPELALQRLLRSHAQQSIALPALAGIGVVELILSSKVHNVQYE